MSWSSGNIQWTFPFKSLNGTSCRIDVYKRGYTAEFVYTLRAAANPFYFEEDDSDDLLNDVLRYRTGYIRVIEEYAHGWISEIYPSAPFDRYVEVYYGETLVFNGFIQVQDFSNDQVPVPRVIELPVISPLGLMEKRTFRNWQYQPPVNVTLAALLNTVLINSYTYVYYPSNYGYPNPVNFGMKIMSLVVTPWDSNYHHSMNIAAYQRVMKGQSYSYIIEAICKAFGWIAHDTPDALIFTAFDYEGNYYRTTVGHIGESGYTENADIPSAATDLTTYFTPADSNANITTLQPETGIEINYDGDALSREFNFDYTYIPDENPIVTMPSESSEPDEVNSLCILLPVPMLHEITGVGRLSFTNEDYINVGQGVVAWNGKEGVMISLSGSYPSNTSLFSVRFYIKKRSGQSYRVSYDMKGNANGFLRALAFYDGNVSEYYITTQIDYSHDNYVEVTFKYRFNNNNPQLGNYALIFITNIELQVLEDEEPFAKYRYKPADSGDIISPDGDTSVEGYTGELNPAISSSVTMPISLYRMNDHLIGNSVRDDKLTVYPYMFTPRKHLVSKFRYEAALTFPHVKLFTYMNRKWRIIAQRFDPWNDEYQLTMQNSSVL